MKMNGHTPLDELAELSQASREALQGLWVESVEELASLIAAVQAAPGATVSEEYAPAFAAGPRLAAARLGDARFRSLAARPGGSLGCRVKPEAQERYTACGSVNPPREHAPEAYAAAKLPPAVRLMDALSPVKDQGERGTCVAFGAAALREYLAGGKTPLSEQFLYWACKDLDDLPEVEGTYVHTAMNALAQHGVCRTAKWPYRPKRVPGNEGQGPPPSGAREDAKDFVMRSSRPVQASFVKQYKAILAGDDTAQGMPVVIATLVFQSWFMSAETHRTGKITMPLPKKDVMMGGHAWCVVGYVDDAGAPGGGYFIIRNSWGTGWAAESPEQVGHALMPYAYVERYALEAFSGLAEAGPAGQDARAMDPWDAYSVVLEQSQRDIETKLLPAGTRVLLNPRDPAKVLEDTVENRRRFEEQEFAWDDAMRKTMRKEDEARRQGETLRRQRAVYPEPSDALKAGLDRARAASERFFGAIGDNMVKALRQPFPDVNLPLRIRILPWEPKIRGAEAVADLGSELQARYAADLGLVADLTVPATWAECLGCLLKVQVWRVRALTAEVHVVAAFVAPLRFQEGAEPEFLTPGAEALERVREIYDVWRRESRKDPIYTFYTLANADGWQDSVKGVYGADYWAIFSHPSPSEEAVEDGGFEFTPWLVLPPPHFGERRSLRDFLDRLRPETVEQRLSRIKHYVDEHMGMGGNLTATKVKKATGCRISAVRQAFFTLQASGHYRLYLVEGEVAVERSDGRLGRDLPLVHQPGWFFLLLKKSCLIWLIAVAGLLIGALINHFIMKQPISWGYVLVIGPLAGVVGGWVVNWLKRHLDEKD